LLKRYRCGGGFSSFGFGLLLSSGFGLFLSSGFAGGVFAPGAGRTA
jgi:hypothetical protein